MRLAAFFLSCVGLLTASAHARDVVPAERRIHPWDARIPGCQDPAVLEKITSRFAERESRYWNSGLRLVAYERIRPMAWRPWGLDFIPRRFCTGVTLVSDGRKRQISYVVKEDLGIIGATWGVEWCVQGIDRHWDDAPYCTMDRP